MNEGMAPSARIISSAMASSASVVTPGRTSAAMRSSTRATRSPATAIFSIWALLLSVTRLSGAIRLAPLTRRLRDRAQQLVGDAVDRTFAVDRAQHAALGVVVN